MKITVYKSGGYHCVILLKSACVSPLWDGLLIYIKKAVCSLHVKELKLSFRTIDHYRNQVILGWGGLSFSFCF